MCDSSYQFQYVSIVIPGSTHDSMAMAMSSLARLIARQSDGLIPGFWIAADDAYACTNSILTPWPGRNLSVAQDCFNFWLSSARIHIEQTFGMLVARWGVLWRPLRLSVAKSSRVALVCCKLHNFILQNAEHVSTPYLLASDVAGGRGEIHLQDQCDASQGLHRRRRDLEQSSMRHVFTRDIEELGIARPNY